MSPLSTTLALYIWKFGSNSEFLRWQRSINDATWTFLPSFLASSITSLLFLTFVSCHAGIFYNFFPFFFHCFLRICYFNAWGIEINLCTELQRMSEFIPFATTWSSWYQQGAPNSRGLVSFNNTSMFCRTFSQYHSRFPHRCSFGVWASEHLISYERLFMMFLKSSSSGSMKNKPRTCLALSSFGFSIAHFCFTFRFDASDICFHISGHTLSGLEVVCFHVSLSPDHVYPSGGLTFNKIHLVRPVLASDKSLLPSTFHWSSICFFPTIHQVTYVLFW